MGVRGIVNFLTFLLPGSHFKNFILRLLGHSIGKGAYVGINFVKGCGHFCLDDQSQMGQLNFFRNIGGVTLEPNAHIGNLNWFTSASLPLNNEFPAGLQMGAKSVITNRHYLDLTGGLSMEFESAIWGVRSTVMTHGVKIDDWEQTAGSVRVGFRSVIGSNSVICPGTKIPNDCYFGMGSLISGSKFQSNGLYVNKKSSLQRLISETPIERKYT